MKKKLIAVLMVSAVLSAGCVLCISGTDDADAGVLDSVTGGVTTISTSVTPNFLPVAVVPFIPYLVAAAGSLVGAALVIDEYGPELDNAKKDLENSVNWLKEKLGLGHDRPELIIPLPEPVYPDETTEETEPDVVFPNPHPRPYVPVYPTPVVHVIDYPPRFVEAYSYSLLLVSPDYVPEMDEFGPAGYFEVEVYDVSDVYPWWIFFVIFFVLMCVIVVVYNRYIRRPKTVMVSR